MTFLNDFNKANVNENEVIVIANEVIANEVIANKYMCDCGCNLDFIDYKPGFDVFVGNKWLITNNAMVKYKWLDYITINEYKLWQDFREDIILNYNYALNNEPAKPEDAPWIHLYNREVENQIPLNEKLYYEYVY